MALDPADSIARHVTDRPINTLPACLPVPPSIRQVTVIEVTYCIARRSDDLHHNHVAFYDAETGDLLVDHCTVGARDA